RRRLVVALVAFSLGAWPLIHYNIRNRLETFRGNVAYEKTSLADKAAILQGSFDGSLLFGWLVAENGDTPRPHLPHGWIQTLSANVAALAGDRRNSLMFYGFCAALLLAPLAGAGRRVILFAAITMAVGWVEMLLTATAGSSVHHTI